MLNPTMDVARAQAIFRGRGRLQIHDVLQRRAADLLVECLQDEVPWTLAMRRDGKSMAMPLAEYQALDEPARRDLLTALALEARGQYGFAYETYPMITAVIEGRDPGLILHRVTEFLNTPEFIGFARTLTGFDAIRRVSAQATRYRAGHFLRRHDDAETDEGRLVAYVLNLTPGWNPDFGGMLHFIGEDQTVEETFYPWYNSLSVFRVPQQHFVSFVPPYVTASRYAITGWFRT
jgi:SM-20-related protein